MWNQNRNSERPESVGPPGRPAGVAKLQGKRGRRPLLREGVLLLGIILAYPCAALAYTDPGSGALLWQVFVAGFFGLLFYARKFWYRIRRGRNPKEDTSRQREDE